MIIEALLGVAEFILTHLFSLFDFPTLPASVLSVIHYEQFTNAIESGVSIFCAYTHYQFLLALFLFCFAVEAAEEVYKWGRFILRKIPILGIS